MLKLNQEDAFICVCVVYLHTFIPPEEFRGFYLFEEVIGMDPEPASYKYTWFANDKLYPNLMSMPITYLSGIVAF